MEKREHSYTVGGNFLKSHSIKNILDRPEHGFFHNRDFSGGPVVQTLHFHCRRFRSDLWLGN